MGGKRSFELFLTEDVLFPLVKEVLGRREDLMAMSVMPRSVFFSAPLVKNFVSLTVSGGLGKRGYFVKCLLSNVFVLT